MGMEETPGSESCQLFGKVGNFLIAAIHIWIDSEKVNSLHYSHGALLAVLLSFFRIRCPSFVVVFIRCGIAITAIIAFSAV
jgi:hypothetical protein